MPLKKLITSYPMLTGVFVSVLLSVALFSFPGIGDFHDRHKRLVQGVLFTIIYFGVYIFGLRRWWHRSLFWPSICALFLFHVLGVFYYSTRVQPILVWQWPFVGLLEYYGIAFFLDWSARRFSSYSGSKGAKIDRVV